MDDFGVKYSDIADFHALVDCLALRYHVKASPTGSLFLGLTIDYDTGNRALTLSMPSYIPALLHLHRPQGVRLASSPSIYIPPKFGSSAPQMSPQDFSPPASPAQKLELQEVIGSLMYYARILDHTLLPAVTYLACFQAAPTLDTMAAMERLLGYCAKYPNATQVIHPSPMHLPCSPMPPTSTGPILDRRLAGFIPFRTTLRINSTRPFTLSHPEYR